MAASVQPHILFVVDGGSEIGGGHVMRSLTLAQALMRRGASCTFAASAAVGAVMGRFAPDDVNLIAIPSTDPSVLIRMADRPDLAACAAVVFDHFRLGASEQATLARGRPALAIDDLADRALACDLVVDPGPDRLATDYEGLLRDGASILLGPAYALVRPAFVDLRENTLAKRRSGTSDVSPHRVLVSLGLTDVGAITGRVVSRMLPRLGDKGLDVVIGEAAPSRAGLEALATRDPRVVLHIETHAMPALMAQAELAVGAGGSSTWERCALGLPTLLLVLAENQAPAAHALARRGAAEVVDARAPDFEAAFDRAFTGLMRDPARRARLSRESAALCDGLGADRVADAFLGYIKARG